MKLKFSALPTLDVQRIRSGGADANGLNPELAVSDGGGNPCRHCLQDIPAGKEMLVLAYRPFPELQPYAEVGPIFFCADDCERHAEVESCPELVLKRDQILIKGYSSNNRIAYGTGKIVPTESVDQEASRILANPDVAYVHLRSATNNCYFARIDRADD